MGMGLLVSAERGLCKIFAHKSSLKSGKKINEVNHKWSCENLLILLEEIYTCVCIAYCQSTFPPLPAFSHNSPIPT